MLIQRKHGILLFTEATSHGKWIIVKTQNPDEVYVDQHGITPEFPTAEEAAKYIRDTMKWKDDTYSAKFVNTEFVPEADVEIEDDEEIEADIEAGTDIEAAGNDLSEQSLREAQLKMAKSGNPGTEVVDDNPEGYNDSPDWVPQYAELAKIKLPMALDLIGRKPWTFNQIVTAMKPAIRSIISKIDWSYRAGDENKREVGPYSVALERLAKILKVDKGWAWFAGYAYQQIKGRALRDRWQSGIIRKPLPRKDRPTETPASGIVSMDATTGDEEAQISAKIPDTTPIAGRTVCPECGGKGTTPCNRCDGTGKISISGKQETCDKCKGDTSKKEICRICKGQRFINVAEERPKPSPLDTTSKVEREPIYIQFISKILDAAGLSPRQKQIIALYFGIKQAASMDKFSEVAKALGITDVKVREAFNRGMEHIRNYIQANNESLNEFLDIVEQLDWDRRQTKISRTSNGKFIVVAYTQRKSKAGERIKDQYEWTPAVIKTPEVITQPADGFDTFDQANAFKKKYEYEKMKKPFET
jgi:hypothetical protein